MGILGRLKAGFDQGVRQSREQAITNRHAAERTHRRNLAQDQANPSRAGVFVGRVAHAAGPFIERGREVRERGRRETDSRRRR